MYEKLFVYDLREDIAWLSNEKKVAIEEQQSLIEEKTKLST